MLCSCFVGLLFRLKEDVFHGTPEISCLSWAQVSADLAQGTVDQAAYNRWPCLIAEKDDCLLKLSMFPDVFDRLLPHGGRPCGRRPHEDLRVQRLGNLDHSKDVQRAAERINKM